MRNVLVISSSEWPVAALRAALGDDIDELRVVVPSVHQSRLQWLTNADDDARVRADAAASFERALELRPSDPVTLVWLAETFLDDGRPDEAESTFVKALSVQPRFAAALFGAGRAAQGKRQG